MLLYSIRTDCVTVAASAVNSTSALTQIQQKLAANITNQFDTLKAEPLTNPLTPTPVEANPEAHDPKAHNPTAQKFEAFLPRPHKCQY